MAETFLSIQEAAQISGKSIQTIRRALKTNRLIHKQKKTPQGFNYMISREGLIQLYKLRLDEQTAEREKGGLNSLLHENQNLLSQFASKEEFKKLQNELENILSRQKEEKDNFVRFMKSFQDKFVVLEHQFKLLEQPKKKWYHFWK